MSTEKNVSVHVTRRFNISPERVFDAWLDPRKACGFLFATPSGRIVRVDIDPRVGGSFVIVDRRDGDDVAHIGEYMEIIRPRRLVFTFSVPKFSAQRTLVTIDIVPSGSGCELTLTHEDVIPEYASGTEAGWNLILDALDAMLSKSKDRE